MPTYCHGSCLRLKRETACLHVYLSLFLISPLRLIKFRNGPSNTGCKIDKATENWRSAGSTGGGLRRMDVASSRWEVGETDCFWLQVCWENLLNLNSGRNRQAVRVMSKTSYQNWRIVLNSPQLKQQTYLDMKWDRPFCSKKGN